MNSRLMLCLLAVGTALPAAALAQGGNSVGAFGSYWNTDQGGDTWGGGVKGRFGMFELRATYFDDVTRDRGGALRAIKIQDVPVDAGVAFNFAPQMPINPYVGAGVSYHLLDSNIGNIDDEVGWYALLGGEFGMAEGMSLLAEVTYRDVTGTVKDLSGGTLIQDRTNVDLSGFGANVGVAWRF